MLTQPRATVSLLSNHSKKGSVLHPTFFLCSPILLVSTFSGVLKLVNSSGCSCCGCFLPSSRPCAALSHGDVALSLNLEPPASISVISWGAPRCANATLNSTGRLRARGWEEPQHVRQGQPPVEGGQPRPGGQRREARRVAQPAPAGSHRREGGQPQPGRWQGGGDSHAPASCRDIVPWL